MTGDDDPSARVVAAMLEQLEPICLAELEQALSLLLKTELSPAERRVRDLGFVAEILNATPREPHQTYPLIRRQRYDALRAQRKPDAPASERLVHHYGNGLWRMVCRKAYGVLADGRYVGISSPLPTHCAHLVAPYTRAEVWAAVNRCAVELGRIPSSHDYKWWAMRTHRRLRELGPQSRRGAIPAVDRLPVIEVLYRLYPPLDGDRRGDRWARALRDARVSAAAIAAARYARLIPGRDAPAPATPAEALDAIPLETLATIGIDEEMAAQILEWGCNWLPLPTAAPLARTLGGSLAWLGGYDADRGAPAEPNIGFDLDALNSKAKRAKKATQQLRLAARTDAAGWRKLLAGARQPTLAELFAIAQALSVTPAELTKTEVH